MSSRPKEAFSLKIDHRGGDHVVVANIRGLVGVRSHSANPADALRIARGLIDDELERLEGGLVELDSCAPGA